MGFNMHESGLHCYNTTDKAVVLINTVSVNKQLISKRQIKTAEQEKLCTPNLGIHQLNISGGFFKSNKL